LPSDMTAVLLSRPTMPGGLLDRRRLSNVNFGPDEMAQLMAGYQMSLKHGMDAMLPQQHYMPCTNQGPHPGMQAMSLDINLPTTSMAQDTMAFGNNALAACSMPFTNPYNLATTFNAGMPTVPHPHQMNDWPSYGVSMATMQVPDMRRDSIASLQSCPPLIKSEEEQSPIQPSQMFYNTPMYCSQRGSPSSSGTDEGKESNFSTDVDVLMKAIQSKHKQPAQPKPMVLPRYPQRLTMERTNLFSSHPPRVRQNKSPLQGLESDTNARFPIATSLSIKRHISKFTLAHTLA